MVSLKSIRYVLLCCIILLSSYASALELVKEYSTAEACERICGKTCLMNAVTGKYSCPIAFEPITPIETCTSGQKQYKPKGDCETSTRTCCSNGTWSDWDDICPTTMSCSASSKPATSQSCTTSSGASGTQTRTVTCNTSTGKWTTGSWSTCKCSKTCTGSDILDEGTCQCCWLSCYLFASRGATAGACNCKNWSYALGTTCCTMTNGNEYQLPPKFSSCSEFANSVGLTLNNAIAAHACGRFY